MSELVCDICGRPFYVPPMPERHSVTPKQREVYDFIASYIAKNGFGPSFDEIKDHLGLASKAPVAYRIDGLKRAGWLAKPRGKSRAYILLGPVDPEPQP